MQRFSQKSFQKSKMPLFKSIRIIKANISSQFSTPWTWKVTNWSKKSLNPNKERFGEMSILNIAMEQDQTGSVFQKARAKIELKVKHNIIKNHSNNVFHCRIPTIYIIPVTLENSLLLKVKWKPYFPKMKQSMLAYLIFYRTIVMIPSYDLLAKHY